MTIVEEDDYWYLCLRVVVVENRTRPTLWLSSAAEPEMRTGMGQDQHSHGAEHSCKDGGVVVLNNAF